MKRALYVVLSVALCTIHSSHVPTPGVQNLCNILNATSMYCYCDSYGDAHNDATDASCWIYNETTPVDVIWDYFSTQTKILSLKFILRPDGDLGFIPTTALGYMKHLTVLEIQYANIPEVRRYAFANLSHLEELTLTRNQIITLKKQAFANLPRLKMLALGENRIAEVPRRVFANLPRLEKLYVEINNVTVIHDRAFVGLHRLQELELHRNQISVLTKDTFAGLRSLRRLVLRENRLEMLGAGTFWETPSLAELDLERNRMRMISEDAFSGLDRLERLYLGENRLVSLGDIFWGVPNIYYLDLRNNRLETLTSETMEPLTENMKNVTMYLLLEGNSFMCDCRLNWMRTLWNETKNYRVQSTLEHLTCTRPPIAQHGDSHGQEGSNSSALVRLFQIPEEELNCESETDVKMADKTTTHSSVENTEDTTKVKINTDASAKKKGKARKGHGKRKHASTKLSTEGSVNDEKQEERKTTDYAETAKDQKVSVKVPAFVDSEAKFVPQDEERFSDVLGNEAEFSDVPPKDSVTQTKTSQSSSKTAVSAKDANSAAHNSILTRAAFVMNILLLYISW